MVTASLAGHRVDDEERVVRLDRARDAADLVHHLLVDGQPAGGVDDGDIAPDAARFIDALARGLDGVARL